MSHSSPFRPANDESSAHSWLQEKVYAPKRQRTVALVTRSVDALVQEKQRVSLASVVAKSKELDLTGLGISESAILGNDEARAYYERHRSWWGSRGKRSKGIKPSSEAATRPMKIDRDLARARQRYLQMGKAELVERLLSVEQAYADHQERWLQQQDEVLLWRLRAEAALARLKETGQDPREAQNEKGKVSPTAR